MNMAVCGKATHYYVGVGRGNGCGGGLALTDRPGCIWSWAAIDAEDNYAAQSTHTNR